MLDDSLLKKKIQQALTYRFLIGDINFSDEEKEKIRDEFFRVYKRHSANSWKYEISDNELDIIAITLIITVKNYPKDWKGKEFWPKIADSLNAHSNDVIVDSKFPYNVLEKIRNRLTDRGTSHNCVFFVSKSGKQQYAQSLMFQAYAPRTSIRAFIRLAWSLYSDLFSFSFSFKDKLNRDLCSDVIDRLSNRSSAESDLDSDIQVGGNLYQIRAALKYGFEQDPTSSTLLLGRILSFINEIYSERKDLSIKADSDYLASLVSEEMKGILSPSERKRGKRRSLPFVPDPKKIDPRFAFAKSLRGEPRIEIVTNSAKLDESFVGSKEATLRVTALLLGNSLRKVAVSSSPVISSDFLPTIEELRVDVTDFLKMPSSTIDFRVTLEVDGRVIFEKDIRRSFILMKGNAEFIGDCRPGDYWIFYSNKFSLENSLKIKNGYERTSSNSAFFSASSGDSIVTNDGHTFFAITMADVNCSLGPDTEETGLRVTVEDGEEKREYSVLKKADFLLLETESASSLDRISVDDVCDGEFHDLKRAGIDGLSEKSMKLSIKDLEPYKRHDIKISSIGRDGKKTLKGVYRIVIDPSADFALPNEGDIVSYGESVLNVSWRFGNLHGSMEMMPGQEEARIDLTKLSTNRPSEQETGQQADFEIADQGKGLFLSFDVSYFKWAIDEEDFQSHERDFPLWCGEIYSNELIHVSTNMDAQLFVENTALKPSANGKNYFQLSQAVSGQEVKKEYAVYANVSRGGISQTLHLFTICNTPCLTNKNGCEELFSYSEEGVKVLLPNFYCGPSNTLFHLSFKPLHGSSKPIHVDGRFCESGDFPVLGKIPDNEYEVSLSAKYVDPRSQVESEIVLLNGESISFGSPNRYLYDGVSSLTFKRYRCPDGSQQRFKKIPVSISDIYFVDEEEFPIYRGKMRIGKGKPVDVLFRAKTKENIQLCYRDADGEVRPMCSNSDGTKFFGCQPDDHKYFICRSIYCEEEMED